MRTAVFITFVLIYALNSLYTTYILPLRDILRYKKRTQSTTLTRKSLSRLLENPDDFHAFLLFSVKDFSVENALFYRRYQQVAKKVQRLLQDQEKDASMSEASSDQGAGRKESVDEGGASRLRNTESSAKGDGTTREKHGSKGTCPDLGTELENIYSTFLAPNSHYELNVPRKMVMAVRRRLDEKEYQLKIFDEVLEEVQLLMFQNTYPRFIEGRRNSLQTATLV